MCGLPDWKFKQGKISKVIDIIISLFVFWFGELRIDEAAKSLAGLITSS